MTKLYEASNSILIHTGYADPTEHRHAAAHVIISLGGSLDVRSEGRTFSCRGVMIPSGFRHSVDTGGAPALVFLYDCTCASARQITRLAPIAPERCDTIAAAYSRFARCPSAGNYRGFEACVLSQLTLPPPLCCVSDERILSAMGQIRAAASEPLSCSQAAGAVHLSQGRFSHLFRRQVGMTFASYLIYRRLMRVYADLLRGKSVTRAAVDAGFAGSSHFADTNRRVFGLCASSVIRGATFVKVC